MARRATKKLENKVCPTVGKQRRDGEEMVCVRVAAGGLPLSAREACSLRHTLNEACRKTAGALSPHGSLHADKGYDSVTHKNICRTHGLDAIIPQRRTLPRRDSIRIMIEIAIGRFDKFRRIIMRYDSRIASMKSFHYIAGTHMFP